MMIECMLKSTEELQQEFDAAKEGINPEITLGVMRGVALTPSLEHTESIRALRQAWSRLHERLRYR